MVIQQIKSEIKNFVDINYNGEINPYILWDTVMRGKVIPLNTALKKEKCQLKQLENDLKELERQYRKNQDLQTHINIKDSRNQILNSFGFSLNWRTAE